MAIYSVRILKSASRELEALDKQVAKRIVAKIQWLSENLESLKPTALKGELSGLFKLREGDFRIIYQILAQGENCSHSRNRPSSRNLSLTFWPLANQSLPDGKLGASKLTEQRGA